MRKLTIILAIRFAKNPTREMPVHELFSFFRVFPAELIANIVNGLIDQGLLVKTETHKLVVAYPLRLEKTLSEMPARFETTELRASIKPDSRAVLDHLICTAKQARWNFEHGTLPDSARKLKSTFKNATKRFPLDLHVFDQGLVTLFGDDDDYSPKDSHVFTYILDLLDKMLEFIESKVQSTIKEPKTEREGRAKNPSHAYQDHYLEQQDSMGELQTFIHGFKPPSKLDDII